MSVNIKQILTAEEPYSFFRHAYSRVRIRTEITDPSLTHQSHKENCCINKIMRHVERTGMLPPQVKVREPQYGDVSHLNRPFDQLLQESRDTLQSVNDVLKSKAAADAKAKADKIAEDAKLADEYRAAKAAAEQQDAPPPAKS